MSAVQDHDVAPQAKEVRSSVDLDAFFRATKHMFASSDSYIGELMQNARRAGASGVRFDIDPQKRTMTVSDDGDGVQDFQALVRMCQSAWKEQVTLTDKPFGMGMFSVFHAAERVCIRSGGQKISFSIEDIVSSKALPILADPDGPARGTVIELVGVDKLDAPSNRKNDLPLGEWAIGLTMRNIAKGFGIPVYLNDYEVPRPYAEDQLVGGHATPVGYVWNSDLAAGALARRNRRTILLDIADATFLQGLPIHGLKNPIAKSTTVLHLDSSRFTARMPDRSHLYDEAAQFKVIDENLKSFVRQRLSEIKAAISSRPDGLSGEDGAWFAFTYFAIASQANCLALFDDVPWLPAHYFFCLPTTDMRQGPALAAVGDIKGSLMGCIPRSAIASGDVLLWRNVPKTTFEFPWAATILSAASRLPVVYPREMLRQLGEGHWLNAFGTDTLDLRFEIVPKNPRGSYEYELDSRCYSVRAVDGIEVRMRSASDPRIDMRLELPFLPVPVIKDGQAQIDDFAYDSDDEGAMGRLCDEGYEPGALTFCVLYVDPRYNDPESHLRQICRFEGEFERPDDEWLNESIEQWQTVLGQLENRSLAHQTNVLLREGAHRALLSDVQRSQLAVVAAAPGGGPVALDVLGPAGLTELCQALAKAGAFGITPDTLHTALRGVVDRRLEQQYRAEFARQAHNVADDGDDESQHDRPRGG